MSGIDRLGLGCAGAWGRPWFSERQAVGIVHRAIELGVRAFDTGPSYSGGLAERRLGRALKGVDRDDMLVSTKVGTHVGRDGKPFHDLSREAVLRSVDASRRHLGLDRIPLLYLHGPNPWELDARLLDLLEELRLRGWVASLGINSYDHSVVEGAATLPGFDTFMIDYNLLRAGREEILRRLRIRGHRVVSGSALANHLHDPRFLWPRGLQDVWYSLRMLRRYRRDWFKARQLRFLSGVPDWTPAQLALAFVLDNPDVDLAMFGTTRLEHLEENLSVVRRPPPSAVLDQLRSVIGANERVQDTPWRPN